MTQRLAIAGPLTWTPDTSFYERDLEIDAQNNVELFSPSGHRCQLTFDAIRALSSFGRGATVSEVRERLRIADGEVTEFSALVDTFVRRGLLRPVSPTPPPKPVVPPTFLVSAHASGATLARWLLDSHPAIACCSPHRLGNHLQEFVRSSQQRGAFTALDVKARDAVRLLGATAQTLLDQYARRRQKQAWVWPSRDHDLCLGFLDDMFQQAGRFIVLVRHPFDAAETAALRHADPGWQAERVVASIRRHGDPRIAYAHHWLDVYSRIRIFTSTLPAGRSIVLRYEDLVREPDREIARICDALGIARIDDLSRHAFERPHEVLDWGWESKSLRSARAVSDAGVGLWKAWSPQVVESMDAVLRAEIERWGYSAHAD